MPGVICDTEEERLQYTMQTSQARVIGTVAHTKLALLLKSHLQEGLRLQNWQRQVLLPSNNSLRIVQPSHSLKQTSPLLLSHSSSCSSSSALLSKRSPPGRLSMISG